MSLHGLQTPILSLQLVLPCPKPLEGQGKLSDCFPCHRKLLEQIRLRAVSGDRSPEGEEGPEQKEDAHKAPVMHLQPSSLTPITSTPNLHPAQVS